MIKNIILDFGKVLTGLDTRTCVESFKAINAAEIAVYVDECRSEDLFRDLEGGRIDTTEFCQRARLQAPGCKASDEEIVGAWNSLLTGVPERKLRRMVELSGEYRLFILSNTNPPHWARAKKEFFAIDGMQLSDYVEKAYISCELKLLKPHADIYEYVLRDAGLKAEETLFVDDSEANCRGAEAVGINVLHDPTGEAWLSIEP